MKKNNFLFLVICIFLLSACEMIARENYPYLVYGEMVMDDSADYEVAGLNLMVKNKSEKEIDSFTIVFFLFDEDGNPPDCIKNSLVFTIEAQIDPNEVLETCICLDNYLYSIPQEAYQVDYMYLSKISYSDGSIWSDPLGMKVF